MSATNRPARRARPISPSRWPTELPTAAPWILLGLMGLGLLARVVLALRQTHPSHDGAILLGLARGLVGFGSYSSATIAPGFPLLVAPILAALGWEDPVAPLRAAQIVNGMLGVLLGGMGYTLAKPRLGAWGALAVAGLLLAWPIGLRVSIGDVSEPLLSTLMIGALLLQRAGRAVIAGVALAAAMTVDPSAGLMLVGLALVELRARPRDAGLIVLAAALGLGLILALLALSGTGSATALRGALQTGLGLARSDAMAAYAEGLHRAVTALRGELGPTLLFLAALGGIAHPGRWLLLLLPMLALPWQPLLAQDHHTALYLAPLLVGAGLGIRFCGEQFFERGAARVAVSLALVAALSLTGVSLAARYRGVLADDLHQADLQEIGLWLRGRIPGNAIVVDGLPYTAYWAGCRYLQFPRNVGATVAIEWARQRGGNLLVVHAGIAATRFPEMLPLVGEPPEHLRARIRPIYSFRPEGEPHRWADVYVLAPPGGVLADPDPE